MAYITNQDLQDIAVKCTSDFLNNQVPLNEGLAKQASELGLNSDQLRRAVEVTNTLAFLKSAQVAGDKTVEFPLANYTDIIKEACIPDMSHIKEASEVSSLSTAITPPESFEKRASLANEALSFEMPSLDKEQLIKHIQKQAALNERMLVRALGDAEVLKTDLLKTAEELRKNPSWKEALSAQEIEDSLFEKLAFCVSGQKEHRISFSKELVKAASYQVGYKVTALRQSENLVSLYKEASSLLDEISTRQAHHDAAQALIKEAFLGNFLKAAPKAISTLGQAATGTLGNRIKAVSARYPKIGEKLLRDSKASSVTGRGIGRVLGGSAKLVGKAGVGIASIPARAIKNTVVGAASAVGRNTQNAFAKTGWGKELKVPTRAPNPVFARNMKRLGVGAAVATDVAFYSPSTNIAGDRSGNVWNALQS